MATDGNKNMFDDESAKLMLLWQELTYKKKSMSSGVRMSPWLKDLVELIDADESEDDASLVAVSPKKKTTKHPHVHNWFFDLPHMCLLKVVRRRNRCFENWALPLLRNQAGRLAKALRVFVRVRRHSRNVLHAFMISVSVNIDDTSMWLMHDQNANYRTLVNRHSPNSDQFGVLTIC